MKIKYKIIKDEKNLSLFEILLYWWLLFPFSGLEPHYYIRYKKFLFWHDYKNADGTIVTFTTEKSAKDYLEKYIK